MARTSDSEARPASLPAHDFRWARKRTTTAVAGIAVLAIWLSWVAPPVARAATPPPLRAAHAAVASDNPLASAAGLSLLQAGGNAIDAACATALALGVVHPFASGIGGGGFAVVYVAKEKKVYALDFRERAPAAIRPDSFLRDGRADPALSATGGLAVAVPGEVRGLGELVRRWGALPFRKCVEPAQRLAARGFPVSWRLAESFGQLAEKKTAPPGAAANGAQAVKSDPVFDSMFAGKLLTTADRWKRPDLAWTLNRLRAGGADAFYKGEIASAIVKAVKDSGGVMGVDDLTSYAPSDRVPLESAYRGLRVFSMPPSSSGGIVLIETLGILSARYPDGAALTKLGRNSSAYLHVLAEAFKHGFADRARQLGDTDFVTVDLAHLTSAAYHRELAARIKDDGVQPRDSYGMPGGPAALHRDGGTTNLCVIDAEGNAVALTTTVNLGFGAKVVAAKTGILLNDQMDDFSLEPGVPNAFGLVGSTQNAVAPRKRPLSSMTPTIVLDGDRVKMTAGAAGGPTIITATTQVLLNVLDFGLDAQAAVSSPRVHDQWMPEVLSVEPDIVVDVRQGLERRGQKLRELPRIGVANAIVRTERGLEAAAEPRSAGAPAGY